MTPIILAIVLLALFSLSVFYNYKNKRNSAFAQQESERKLPMLFMFDLVRAVAYLVVAYMLFTAPPNQYVTKDFVRIFAGITAAYGLFRLWRSSQNINFKQK
jgi:hypothetical protein